MTRRTAKRPAVRVRWELEEYTLAAQRSAVSSRREEVAQREPLEGFPLDSFGNRGAAAPLAPQAARYGRLYQLSVLTYF